MWWVAAGTQNLLQCTPNINKQCLLSNRLQNFFDLSHITTGTWLWKVHFIIYYGRRRLSKNKAAGWMRTINECEAAASETLIWANSCKQTHTKTLRFNFTHAIFVIVYYRPRLRRRRPFLQADISLKRYCPWKIWPFILMLTQINDPKSTIVSQKQYTGIYST